jgi:hypothetical protein
MTLQERYTRYLVEHGWQRDHTRPQSTKYQKFSHPHKSGWYWLGKNGAIRFNFDNNSSHSYDSSFRVKHLVITWEKKHGYGN